MSNSLPALFMRGGTSKALMLRRADLPADEAAWDPPLLTAMGSPDPYGRQLNGMGGGLSSLSKVCVVGLSALPEADVDFTFAQVQIRRALVDYSGNCGNMTAAIGPFALHAGLLRRADGPTSVTIFNTNTSKFVRASFDVVDGLALEEGDLAIPGVAGTGAPVRLEFIDPGGPATGRLLPTGRPTDQLRTDAGTFTVSMVDAGNACVFVPASELELSGVELPDAIESRADVLSTLATIRAHAAVKMGLASSVLAADDRPLTPFVAMVGPPKPYASSDGAIVDADDYDLAVRYMSNGQAHRAIPGTGALCSAVAARIPGSVVSDNVRDSVHGALRLSTPAGVMTVDALVEARDDAYVARSATTYRTFRRLFTGEVFT
jgi:hypothetical protein